MNNKKVEYNAKYQTGKEDGFIILDKKEVPVDKLTYCATSNRLCENL